jgi:subtilisin family serine protease
MTSVRGHQFTGREGENLMKASRKRSCYIKLLFIFGICLDGSMSSGSQGHLNTLLKRRGFDEPHSTNDLIIKLNPSFSNQGLQWLKSEFGGEIVHQYRASGAYLVKLPLTLQAAEVSQQIASHPEVDYVEANTIIRLTTKPAIRLSAESLAASQAAGDPPNDPKLTSLWGMNNTGADGGVVDADIDALEAWNLSTGSKKIVTAIIDTGVDYTHPDIANNYWYNPGEVGVDDQGKNKESNGIDDDQNGFIDDFRGWDFANNDNDPKDDHEHGTHCAGTIGAVGNNNLGVVGVNWNTSLVGLKFLDESGSGSLDHAVQAIEYATSLGVDLTSNSWGGGGFSETMYAAIQEAAKKGVLFVAAAGNGSQNNDQRPTYPASYSAENIISVAAFDRKDKLASFSNYGAQSVHVGAPGVDILSTIPGAAYGMMSGTSMATPHVSGVAALIKATYPQLSVTQWKNRILYSSKVSAATALKTTTGGRLNALNALEDDQIPPARIEELTIKSMGLNQIDITFNSVGDDGLEGMARAYEIKFSDTPIQSNNDWIQATTVFQGNHFLRESLTPMDETSRLSKTEVLTVKISGLKFESRGYLAIRAFDNVGNFSDFSESLEFELPKIYNFFVNNASSLTGVKADAPWGLETLGTDMPPASDGLVFSDSPGKEYKSNVKSFLTLDPIPLPAQSQVFLKIAAWVRLEENFDFIYTEVSTDNGATWKRVGAITGRHPWRDFIFELTPVLGNAKEVLVRLRLETDSSVNDDGIKVDQISLFTHAMARP